MAQWKEIQCWDCNGHGLVSSYTGSGDDFLGAAECKTCNGSGKLSQSSGGAIAQYPGGPFVGRVTNNDPTIR